MYTFMDNTFVTSDFFLFLQTLKDFCILLPFLFQIVSSK